jgi:hypothetical protein
MKHTLRLTLGALLVAVSTAGMAEMTRQERMDEALQNYRTNGNEPSRMDRAENSVERGAKKTGNAVERGAKKTGNAVEHGAKKTGQAVGRGVEKTGEAIEHGGEKLQQKSQ